MQDNDLIGKVILSSKGKDRDHLYVVTNIINEKYISISDGDTKTVQMPKKKNLKHVKFLNDVDDEIKESILLKDRGTDLKIKRFLKLRGIVKEG